MGLFGFGKKPKENDKVKWLNAVDKEYQRAFQVKNAAGLSKYLTRTCLAQMMERIRLGEKGSAGLARYQHVEWVPVPQEDGRKVWLKKVTYDNIKMSYGITVPVGDNCNELWSIVKENSDNKVSDIRREYD